MLPNYLASIAATFDLRPNPFNRDPSFADVLYGGDDVVLAYYFASDVLTFGVVDRDEDGGRHSRFRERERERERDELERWK